MQIGGSLEFLTVAQASELSTVPEPELDSCLRAFGLCGIRLDGAEWLAFRTYEAMPGSLVIAEHDAADVTARGRLLAMLPRVLKQNCHRVLAKGGPTDTRDAFVAEELLARDFVPLDTTLADTNYCLELDNRAPAPWLQRVWARLTQPAMRPASEATYAAARSLRRTLRRVIPIPDTLDRSDQ